MKMRRRKRLHKVRWVTFTQIIHETLRKRRHLIEAALMRTNVLYRRLKLDKASC